MPPVILMGGGPVLLNCGASVPPSPIVEMPPSPATSQMMYVEFPDDEVDDVKACDVHSFIEVRFENNFFTFIFMFFLALSSLKMSIHIRNIHLSII